MATEADIRAVEIARFEAEVDAHGTESERDGFALGVALIGWGRGRLASADPGGDFEQLLARLGRRVERRARLGLPAVECSGDPSTDSCRCLEKALDEPGDGGKRSVLKRAAALHWAPPPRASRPAPEPEDEVATSSVPAPPRPKPEAEPQPTPEPPIRVVRRTPKWFDEPASFWDQKF